MIIREAKVLSRDDDHVVLDTDIETLEKELQNHRPVILRGVVSPDEVTHIRTTCREWARAETEANPEIDGSCPNYHRINDWPEKSQVKSISHQYSFFYWNDDDARVHPLFRRCYKLRNQLSGLSPDYALNEIEDGFISVPMVVQYPKGGGCIQPHTDPDNGQKVVMLVILSDRGKDFDEGGLFFTTDDGVKVSVDDKVSAGDAFLFYPQTLHGVDPIDPAKPIDWNRDDGRWIMFSILVTQDSLNGAPGSTAGKAVY